MVAWTWVFFVGRGGRVLGLGSAGGAAQGPSSAFLKVVMAVEVLVETGQTAQKGLTLPIKMPMNSILPTVNCTFE